MCSPAARADFSSLRVHNYFLEVTSCLVILLLGRKLFIFILIIDDRPKARLLETWPDLVFPGAAYSVFLLVQSSPSRMGTCGTAILEPVRRLFEFQLCGEQMLTVVQCNQTLWHDLRAFAALP